MWSGGIHRNVSPETLQTTTDNHTSIAEQGLRPGESLPAVLLAELVHAAARINDLLFARVKGMARRANFYDEIIAKRRTRCELVAATTGYFDDVVVGMDIGFHFDALHGACRAKRARNISGSACRRKSRRSGSGLSTEPVDKVVDEN
jgi:hypothetical protein